MSTTRSMSDQVGPTGLDPVRLRPIPHGRELFDLIVAEHTEVRTLYEKFQQSQDDKEKQAIIYECIRLISLHGQTEEMSLYPFLYNKLPNGPELFNHAIEEHQEVKILLKQIDELLPTNPEREQLFHKALQSLIHHVEEEEQQLLPMLNNAISDSEATWLCDDFVLKRGSAPSRPHPEIRMSVDSQTLVAENYAAKQIDDQKDSTRFALIPNRYRFNQSAIPTTKSDTPATM